MCNKSVTIFNLEINAEVIKLFIIELLAIIGDDDPREAKSRDDRLSDEISDFFFDDFGLQLSFYLLSEVINSYKKKFLLH